MGSGGPDGRVHWIVDHAQQRKPLDRRCRSRWLVIQDDASVNVGGELAVNYQNSEGNPSSLQLTGGSLHVAGSTFVGQAAMRTDPSNTNAVFNQTGGRATLKPLRPRHRRLHGTAREPL